MTTTASGSLEGGAAFVAAATTVVAASASAFLASASAFLTFLAGAALAPAPPRLPLPVLVSFSGVETTTGSVFLLSLCLGAFVSATVAAATEEQKIHENYDFSKFPALIFHLLHKIWKR